MQECKIYFSIDDDLTEADIREKGWRGDVIVEIDGLIFNPTIMTPNRLLSEFNFSLRQNRFYDTDPNLVFVEETSRQKIIDAVVALKTSGYFSKIKPIDLQAKFKDEPNLQTLNGWIRVY